jgi:hypothetical protein
MRDNCEAVEVNTMSAPVRFWQRMKEIEQLHPSVRRDFIECLEEKRRKDEYEARQNEP